MWSPAKSVDVRGNEGISGLYGTSVVAVMNDFRLDRSECGFLKMSQNMSAAVWKVYRLSRLLATDRLVDDIGSRDLESLADPGIRRRCNEQ